MAEEASSLETPDALVARYLGGDELAFAEIYRRYSTELFHFAYRSLGDTEQAADVTESTFSLAASRLAHLRDASKLRAWLYAVMRNEISHLLRSTVRERRRLERLAAHSGREQVEAAPDDDGSGEGEGELARSVLAAARTGLTEDDQVLLGLVLSGLSSGEVAEALGIDVGAANTRKSRLYDRVRLSVEALWATTRGRRDCPELDELLRRRSDHELSRSLCRAVGRHFETCALCDERRRRLSPLSLLAAAPLPVLPARLAWSNLAASFSGLSHGPSSPGVGGPAGTGPHSPGHPGSWVSGEPAGAHASGSGGSVGSGGSGGGPLGNGGQASSPHGTSPRAASHADSARWLPDGFPPPARRARRIGNRSVALASGVTAVVAVVIAIVLATTLLASSRPAGFTTKVSRLATQRTVPPSRPRGAGGHRRAFAPTTVPPTTSSSSTTTGPSTTTTTTTTSIPPSSSTSSTIGSTAGVASTTTTTTRRAAPSQVHRRSVAHHPITTVAPAPPSTLPLPTLSLSTTPAADRTPATPRLRRRHGRSQPKRPPTTTAPAPPSTTSSTPTEPSIPTASSLPRTHPATTTSRPTTTEAASTTIPARRGPRPKTTTTTSTSTTLPSTTTSSSTTSSSTTSSTTSTSSTTTTSSSTTSTSLVVEPQITGLEASQMPGACAASFSAQVEDSSRVTSVELVYGFPGAEDQTAQMNPTITPDSYSAGPIYFRGSGELSWAVTATDVLGRTSTVRAGSPLDVGC